MADVTVRALKAFDFNGRQFQRGQPVTMTPLEASIRARKGEVSLDRGYNSRADEVESEPQAEPEQEAQPVRRRRYRRRDMTAEP